MSADYGSLRARHRTKRSIYTCMGKEPFESFTLATEIARGRSRRGKRNNVYRCDGCQKFHLGSPNAAVRSIKQQRRREALEDAEELEA